MAESMSNHPGAEKFVPMTKKDIDDLTENMELTARVTPRRRKKSPEATAPEDISVKKSVKKPTAEFAAPKIQDIENEDIENLVKKIGEMPDAPSAEKPKTRRKSKEVAAKIPENLETAPLTATEIIMYLQDGTINKISKNEEEVLLKELDRRYREWQNVEPTRGFFKRFFKSDEEKSYRALHELIEKMSVVETKLPSAE